MAPLNGGLSGGSMSKNSARAAFAGVASRSAVSRLSAAVAGLLVGGIAGLGSPLVLAAPGARNLALPETTTVAADSARAVSGKVSVVIQLTGPSLAKAMGPSRKSGVALDRAAQRAHLQAAKAEQDAVSQLVVSLGGKEIGRVSKALNAVIASVDVSEIDTIASAPGVTSVRRLRSYQMHLSETVPYIGARSGAFAQPGGATGAGVKVAVLDSGIDYTHANLGGAGTLAAYAAAYGAGPGDPLQTTRDGLFPTAKVVAGYDFVGEAWPNGPLAPDPDPIDFEGHGSHVADIIGGAGGVAPGASLVAVKVCSAVSSSCSGEALLQGMDFALDPNGDGDISDAVDVINMSLGSSYGQVEDDLSFAAQNAVDFGVTVVVSAGNSADRPYIVGSPSSTPGVISVAQTQVPGAVAYPLVVTGITPSVITNTATVEWAPIGAGFSGGVVRVGRLCPGDAIFNNNSMAGKVALADRGTCSVSLKSDIATKAGAVAVIIANNVAGDPPSFSFGGGDLPLAPTIVISQSDGNRIKTALGTTGVNAAVVASVSPNATLSLAGSMAGTSSRGPSMSFDAIKPDIGAPGASISAIAGSGTGTEAFGGTSGAAPMVAGSAALLLSVNPAMDPLTVKARLMGTGETTIYTNPATLPGVLAPITRIGGGEVRVDAAAAVSTIAFDGASRQPSLSFGYQALTQPTTVQRRLTIRNLSGAQRSYTITPAFRYQADAASGAVTPSIVGGGSVTVNAGGETTVTVRLQIDPSRLPAWPFAASSLGTGSRLNTAEYDGYITVSGGGDEIRVPWHVLPRAVANVATARPIVNLSSAKPTIGVSNNGGAIDGEWSAFALTGSNGRVPRGLLPGPGDNVAAIDLKSVGVRAFPDFDVIQFAVNTWDERSHPAYPAGFEVQIDTNRDGAPDWFVYQQEQTGFAATGVSLVYVLKAGALSATAYYFLDADLNSSNRVFSAPMSVMGITAATQFDYTVLAYDNYFSGVVTDAIGPMRYTAGTPRYTFGGGLSDGVVPAGAAGAVPVTAVPGGAAASPSQTGILLMHYANPQAVEATTIDVRP
jgi:subtilisin family serine protease